MKYRGRITTSLRGVDTVDRSVTLVLHSAVADGRSEQSLVFAGAGHAVSRNAGLDLVMVVLVLRLHALEAVEALSVFNFLEGDELVKSLLADGDDLLEHIPENAFAERRGRQRALVGPSLLVLEAHDKGGEVQLHEGHVTVVVAVLVVLRKLVEEAVVGVGIGLEVRVRNDLEEEA